jgi:hypothetical protein
MSDGYRAHFKSERTPHPIGVKVSNPFAALQGRPDFFA